MILHVLRLLRAHGRRHRLLTIKLVCTLVLLAWAGASVDHDVRRSRVPLDFDVRGVHAFTLAADHKNVSATSRLGHWAPGDEPRDPVAHLSEVQRHPAVEAAALVSLLPFRDNALPAYPLHLEDGRKTKVRLWPATTEIREVFNLRVVAGVWPASSPNDDGTHPIAISAMAARSLWGSEAAAIGRLLVLGDRDRTRHRIAGVVPDLALYDDGAPLAFSFVRTPDRTRIAFRLRHGAGRRELDDLYRRVHASSRGEALFRPAQASSGVFVLQAYDLAAQARLLQEPRLSEGQITLFVLILVPVWFSLAGGVWLEVERRTQEFGLRRALGATARAVRRQIALELALLTARASVLGTVLILNGVFLFGFDAYPKEDRPIGATSWTMLARWLTLSGAATLLLLLLVLTAAYLPARRAARLDPIDALRHD